MMSVHEIRRSQEGEERSLQVPEKKAVRGEKNKILMSHIKKERTKEGKRCEICV